MTYGLCNFYIMYKCMYNSYILNINIVFIDVRCIYIMYIYLYNSKQDISSMRLITCIKY